MATAKSSKPQSKLLDPNDIETTAGTQPRASIEQKKIDDFAQDMRNGDLFPQLIVFAEKGSERYILADGFTRLAAHIAVQPSKPIAVEVREGTIFDAKLYAARANAEHGNRRTDKDIRHAISMLLTDPNTQKPGSAWADTVIADKVKCHRTTVAKVREKLIIDGDIDGTVEREHVRKGKKVSKKAPPKKDAKKETSKANGQKPAAEVPPAAPSRSQEDYDKEEIVESMRTLATAVVSGGEALERYKLLEHIDLAEGAHRFLDELISAAPEEKAGDEDAFLSG